LSLDAGVSQGHISFAESGRSVPSRELLLVLAQTMDVPLRERNALLLASGYAPVYLESTWDAPEMAVIGNEASPRFFGSFVDLSTRPRPRNILHHMFDPAGMRPFIVVRLGGRCVGTPAARLPRGGGHVTDKKTTELLNGLKKYPGVKELRMARKSPEPRRDLTDCLRSP